MGNQKENNIFEIEAGTIVKIILVLIAFYAAYLLSDIILVLLTSIVIASAIEPAAVWFMRKRIPRTLAVLIVYGAFISVLGGLFYFFIPPIVRDFSSFFTSFPTYLEFLDRWNPWSDIFDYRTVTANLFGGASVSDILPAFLGGGQTGVVATVSGFFGGLLNVILILVLSFYLAVQERGIENFLKIIVPAKHEDYIISVWRRSQEKIGKWMQGQLLLGVLVGALVFLGLTIFGVPHALFLAIIAAIFELIPVFGPILAAIPAVIVAFAESAGLGFLIIGWYVVIQQFENHLIYPVVVRKVVGVPPIIVILALLVGVKLGGIMGLILSVPIAAVGMEFFNDLEKKKRG